MEIIWMNSKTMRALDLPFIERITKYCFLLWFVTYLVTAITLLGVFRLETLDHETGVSNLLGACVYAFCDINVTLVII